ncbi:hypothetical protein EIP91_000393 [Steccherinum ochraceum]|uniref:Uncharacterized protein n=1 Tax=Steccherinum ochraceum TaxID=92696 RepID=A0A4V2MWQ9_9APHY|nr:hypothetical protein EIP91_000393 [Steccherinum ochraceum]
MHPTPVDPHRSLPFRLRRKDIHPRPHPPSASDVPYAYSDASASSSPVASSAVLESSEPNSPTDYAHIRAASSPRRDYYYANSDADHHPDFSWNVSPKSMGRLKYLHPDSLSPPSTSYSYHPSPPPLSPVLPALPSFVAPNLYHRPSSSSLSDRPLALSEDGEFDADLSEDDPDPFFASPSHRRRISFSTSCERDRPNDRPPPLLAPRSSATGKQNHSSSSLHKSKHVSVVSEHAHMHPQNRHDLSNDSPDPPHASSSYRLPDSLSTSNDRLPTILTSFSSGSEKQRTSTTPFTAGDESEDQVYRNSRTEERARGHIAPEAQALSDEDEDRLRSSPFTRYTLAFPDNEDERDHVPRRSRPVTPSSSSMRPPLMRKSVSIQPDSQTRGSVSQPGGGDAPLSPLTVYASSSPNGRSARTRSPEPTRRSYSQSPLPPSSPLLPSSPISAMSATAVEMDAELDSPLMNSSPLLLPEVHITTETDSQALYQRSSSTSSSSTSDQDQELVLRGSPMMSSPTPRAVRSTSLLAILNPAPESEQPSSLGLVLPPLRPQSPTPLSVPEAPIEPPEVPSTPKPLLEIKTSLPDSSPLSPALSISLATSPLQLPAEQLEPQLELEPEFEQHQAHSTPSSPLSAPTTPLFLRARVEDEDAEMQSVLSSPLSVIEHLEEDVDFDVEPAAKKRKVDESVDAPRKGVVAEEEDVFIERVESRKVEGSFLAVKPAKSQGKRKEKRSPRVVYSDLESEDGDEDKNLDRQGPSQSKEERHVLPTLLPTSIPTVSTAPKAKKGKKSVATASEAEDSASPVKKPKARGRKRKTDADGGEAGTKKRKKSRSSAPPTDADADDDNAPLKPKRKRPLPTTSQPSASSSSRTTKSKNLPTPPTSPSKTLTAEQLAVKRALIDERCPEGLDGAEMEGMVIVALGSARASSMAVESVWKGVLGARPGLEEMVKKVVVDAPELEKMDTVDEAPKEGNEKVAAAEDAQQVREETLSKREWLSVVQDTLEYGRMSSGVFGRVESSFKDEHAHALPPHYFYVPENDPDPERAVIIRSMMPRPAKRNETKKYKQYYFKPLGKVSRWEGEDAI